MDEFQVIKQVISGNKQAFEKLVLRYQTPLHLYLGRMGMVQAEAEELAQETFIRAFRHLGRFDPQQAQLRIAKQRWTCLTRIVMTMVQGSKNVSMKPCSSYQ
jgi:DNA-directed RNA polymerase specialized sigma24 family protein